jgi:GntR family transcriptional regulator/MocR family aminotransferase
VHSFRANIAAGILLDLSGAGPLHARLTRALRAAIRSGRVAAGSTLPPSRALADELGCSRWVVTQAYAQLAAEGYLAATVGSGTRVCDLERADLPAASLAAAGGRAVTPGTLLDLAPGLPDLRAFPMRRWMTAVRAGAASMALADLAYPDPVGHPRLRQVLAEYLARVRGAQADPADLVITAGATDAIGLLCRTLGLHGHASVAVEDPSWHRLRDVLAAAGLAAVPVPVDEQGLRADLLPARAGVKAVIVSPAHQFPAGVVLSPRRRAALLDWARDADALIIEDDYDAEFRYDRRPVGALQGAGKSSVALIGSVTKTLSPAVGIGWMTTPRSWAPLVRAALVRPSGPPVLDQLAFAAFVETGSYDRHLRAARARYRARRDRVAAALAEHLPEGRVRGVAAGLHVLLELPAGSDAAAVVRRAAAAGVRVANLDTYRFLDLPEAPGLVLGYGNLADHQVDDAVARLAAAVRGSGRALGQCLRPGRQPALTVSANAANCASARSVSGRKSNKMKEWTLSATGLNVTGTPASRAASASRSALGKSASGSAAWMSSGGRPDRSARTGETSARPGSASCR